MVTVMTPDCKKLQDLDKNTNTVLRTDWRASQMQKR